MDATPLVSCIMPTRDRPAFVRAALELFRRQDWTRRELVLVDDGVTSVEALVRDEPLARYVRVEGRRTVGAKRNLACEHARGEVIAHWDDDDWYAPRRLSVQVGALCGARALVCGQAKVLFVHPETGRAFLYEFGGSQRWLSGSSLCYTREAWTRNRFPDIDVGEDARFVAACDPAQLLELPDPTIHVGLIHRGNVSPKDTVGLWWNCLLYTSPSPRDS